MTSRGRSRRRGYLTAVDHLGPEAVAAFVDGEMSPQATHRARVHIVHCAECREEVARQRAAADAIHEATDLNELKAPEGLMARLASIESTCSMDGPDAESVCMGRPEGIVDRMEIFLRTVRRSTHESVKRR